MIEYDKNNKTISQSALFCSFPDMLLQVDVVCLTSVKSALEKRFYSKIIEKQTDRKTERQTDIQTGTQTDKQTETLLTCRLL